MSDWSSALYLKFANQRTQPAIDLARRLTVASPLRVLDVGCGPGNCTVVLRQLFPDADILGVDNSEDMLLRARADLPDARFLHCDVSCQLSNLEGGWDIIFSNACLQWVPSHSRILSELMALLRKGGQLAVQVPVNYDEPIHRIIGRVASSDRWRSHFAEPHLFHTLNQSEYFDLLAELSSDLDMWQTTYFHRMPSHEAIMEWYRSTGLRPYLDVLSTTDRPLFEADIMADLVREYPTQKNGEIIFRFPRFFFIATK